MNTITGKNIILRPYQMEDAETILEGANNPTMRRLTGTQMTFTLEMTQGYVGRMMNPEDRLGYIIAEPQTSAPLGEVVVMDIDDENHSASIRIALFHEEDLNKGYGTEAMRLMVDEVFTKFNLHRLELDVFDFNPRAVRVYEKLGFKQEGVLRDTLFYDGEYHSTIIMSILEDEWRSQR